MSIQPVLIGGQWRGRGGRIGLSGDVPRDRANGWPTNIRSVPGTTATRRWTAAAEAARTLQQLPVERLADFLDAYARGIEEHRDDTGRDGASRDSVAPFPATGRCRIAPHEPPTAAGRRRGSPADRGGWRRSTRKPASVRAMPRSGQFASSDPTIFPLPSEVSRVEISPRQSPPEIRSSAKPIPHTRGRPASLPNWPNKRSRKPACPPARSSCSIDCPTPTGSDWWPTCVSAATGYTGSRAAGLQLKAAADAAGKPIYLELSSVNPVVIASRCVA